MGSRSDAGAGADGGESKQAASPTSAKSLTKFAYQEPLSLKRKPPPSSTAPSPMSKRQTRLSFQKVGRSASEPDAASPSSSSQSPSKAAAAPPPSLQSSSTAPAVPAEPAAARTSTDGITNRLTDSMSEKLILLFIGLNPGIETATSGHAYAHRSNLYWRLMHESGLTATRLPPSEDRNLPRTYRYGHTNIVTRPSRDGSSLKPAELDAGVPVLEAKCALWRPEAVCLVGKGIWEAIFRVWRGRKLGKADAFHYGWQEGRMGAVRGEYAGTMVFVATTTSGLAANMSYGAKLEVWKALAEWVMQRRRERVAAGEPIGDDATVDEEEEKKEKEEDAADEG